MCGCLVTVRDESNAPIVFKCEDSLWQMLAEEDVTGVPAKPFDMRRNELGDDRIYRLTWGTCEGLAGPYTSHVIPHHPPLKGWEPEVKSITFKNKATGETLIRRYVGMEFTDWAPGWCFLVLGERVRA